jgi:hypothetical protein
VGEAREAGRCERVLAAVERTVEDVSLADVFDEPESVRGQ